MAPSRGGPGATGHGARTAGGSPLPWAASGQPLAVTTADPEHAVSAWPHLDDTDELAAEGDTGAFQFDDSDWQTGPPPPLPPRAKPGATKEQIQRISVAGGVTAIGHKTAPGSGRGATAAQIRAIPEASLMALFGQTRTSLITLAVETNKDSVKDYLRLKELADKARKGGTGVPDSFCQDLVFYHFQQDHGALLRRTPLPVEKIELWMYGFGRWAVRKASDDTNSADFNFIRDTASKSLAELDEAWRCIASNPGYTMRVATRRNATDLICKFSAFRTNHVRKIVKIGLGISELASMHDDFRTILAAYEQLDSSLKNLLEALIEQIDNEGLALPECAEQEEFIGRTFIGFFRSFIRGLLGISHVPSSAFTGNKSGTLAAARQAPALAATFNFGAPSASVSTAFNHGTQVSSSSAGFIPAAGDLTTLQTARDAYPSAGPFSLDSIVRQVAHGYRAYGPYIGPGGGGALEGTDLKPEFRRILAAHQILSGLRQYGSLITQPPGELPPLIPYEVAFGPGSSTFATGTTQGGSQQLPAPAYGNGNAQQTPNGSGGRSDGSRGRTAPGALLPQSDELYIPYSYGMLGSFSPYRNMRPPDSCYECGLRSAHFGNECPQRFARIRGEVPPGWRRSGRTADKEPSQWHGPDLTDEARAAYRTFITTHHLSAHKSFLISADDITGDAPPPARKAGGRQ